MDKMPDLYSDYLITQNQYATAVGLSDLLQGRISHDKITRFMNGKEFASKELWKHIKPKFGRLNKTSEGSRSLMI
jgi:hypothetical protein